MNLIHLHKNNILIFPVCYCTYINELLHRLQQVGVNTLLLICTCTRTYSIMPHTHTSIMPRAGQHTFFEDAWRREYANASICTTNAVRHHMSIYNWYITVLYWRYSVYIEQSRWPLRDVLPQGLLSEVHVCSGNGDANAAGLTARPERPPPSALRPLAASSPRAARAIYEHCTDESVLLQSCTGAGLLTRHDTHTHWHTGLAAAPARRRHWTTTRKRRDSSLCATITTHSPVDLLVRYVRECKRTVSYTVQYFAVLGFGGFTWYV